jgi:hypothetical protein
VTGLDPGARARLRLDEHAGMMTAKQAGAFVAEVGVALRYGPSDSLPLASMYHAIARHAPPEPEQDGQRRATELTNALIADGVVIETNAIADRVVVVHRDLAPAVYALRRRVALDELELSDEARRVLDFVATSKRPTAGAVRDFMQVPPKTWPNRADDALAELQRSLVIDRGAVEVPESGAPYLSKDGMPYRVVDREHPALVAAAGKLDVAAAAKQLVGHYLRGAGGASRRKLKSMFKACVSAGELDDAIAALVADGAIGADRESVRCLPRSSPAGGKTRR